MPAQPYYGFKTRVPHSIKIFGKFWNGSLFLTPTVMESRANVIRWKQSRLYQKESAKKNILRTGSWWNPLVFNSKSVIFPGNFRFFWAQRRNGDRGYPQIWNWTKRPRIWAFQILPEWSSKFEQKILRERKVMVIFTIWFFFCKKKIKSWYCEELLF